MDDRWESEVIEYGAINITGYRIVDINKKPVQDAGKELISVSISPPNFSI
jgi:hypothetical protein